jgi:hypothetical protein
MKIKEQAMKELENMDPSGLMIIHDLILSLKNQEARRTPRIKRNNKTKSYIKVRNALKQCCGSLSDEVLSAREDRI